MIKTYQQPTNEELKEFFLCGIRTAYSNYSDLKIDSSNPYAQKAYNCAYCPAWHRIPNINNEAELIDIASKKFDNHMALLFDNTKATLATSNFVILSSN